jgi:hypothetical protein
MMRGTVLGLGVLLLFTICVLEADSMPFAQAAEARTSQDAVWVTFEFFNVTASSPFTVKFNQGRFVGDPKLAKGSPDSLLTGLRLQEGTLSFTPPKSLGSGFSRVAFAAPMVFSGKASGTFDAPAPLVAVINAGWGAVTTQGGDFHLVTESLPPTCTVGCLDDLLCRSTPGGKCYLYDSTFMCCTVCPTGC